jgi:hypothetical protein
MQYPGSCCICTHCNMVSCGTSVCGGRWPRGCEVDSLPQPFVGEIHQKKGMKYYSTKRTVLPGFEFSWYRFLRPSKRRQRGRAEGPIPRNAKKSWLVSYTPKLNSLLDLRVRCYPSLSLGRLPKASNRSCRAHFCVPRRSILYIGLAALLAMVGTIP